MWRSGLVTLSDGSILLCGNLPRRALVRMVRETPKRRLWQMLTDSYSRVFLEFDA